MKRWTAWFYLVLDLSPALARSNAFFAAVEGMNWLYYCVALFAFSIAVMVVVSLFSKPKSDEQLAGLTYKSVSPQQSREARDSWKTGMSSTPWSCSASSCFVTSYSSDRGLRNE